MTANPSRVDIAVLETALMNAPEPSFHIHVKCSECLQQATTDNGEWLLWCGEKHHAEAFLKAARELLAIRKAEEAGTWKFVPVGATEEMIRRGWAAWNNANPFREGIPLQYKAMIEAATKEKGET